jgi:prepilin-type N-terminal cleavage/methylation domain-containing protein
MTTITPSPNRSNIRRRRARGFTLVEVLIGATLSSVILAGTLSSFLFLGRSGVNLRNYNDMESQARKSLEIFAQDTRQASSVTWTTPQSVTLVVPDAASTTTIYYTYASGQFTRQTSTGTATLLSGITNFTFSAYDINGTAITDLSTAAARLTAANATKQIQISLSAARSTRTVATATNIVLSARYVLRNKKVTA